MGIKIAPARLRSVLEEAVMLAESDASLPDEWLRRVDRIGASPSRTYIAAFGTALLAKAADDRVDALTVKAGAGSNAYSMRGVCKVLVERASHYGYHLGVTRGEPLNNQPWFRISRVDEPVFVPTVDLTIHFRAELPHPNGGPQPVEPCHRGPGQENPRAKGLSGPRPECRGRQHKPEWRWPGRWHNWDP